MPWAIVMPDQFLDLPSFHIWKLFTSWIPIFDIKLLFLWPDSRYYIDSNSFLVQEVDGLRIIDNYKHQFLQKVPGIFNSIFFPSRFVFLAALCILSLKQWKSVLNLLSLFIVEVEDVFKLGSMKPGAMLYDANVEYEVRLFLQGSIICYDVDKCFIIW